MERPVYTQAPTNQIMDLIDTVMDKVEEKRADRCFQPAEFDDFDDGAL